MKASTLEPGTRVTVRRISRAVVDGRVIGPVEHLRHIGEFYLIGSMPQGPEPWWRGSGRKSKERLEWEHAQGALGMYERSEILTSSCNACGAWPNGPAKVRQ